MGSPVRVLAVDDEKLVRMNLSLMLGREGFEVDVASTESEARALLGERRYDLVVTDLGLEDGSGIEVLHAAKLCDPDVPVILVTGSPTLLTCEAALAEGAEALLFKPFSLADILEAVRRAVLPSQLGRRAVSKPVKPPAPEAP